VSPSCPVSSGAGGGADPLARFTQMTDRLVRGLLVAEGVLVQAEFDESE
jgi:hypothetical protein